MNHNTFCNTADSINTVETILNGFYTPAKVHRFRNVAAWITACRPTPSEQGLAYRIQLEDGAFSIEGLIWDQDRHQIPLRCPAAVIVDGEVFPDQGMPCIHVRCLEALDTENARQAASVLPGSWLPDCFETQMRLIEICDIPDPDLNFFLARVLTDPMLMQPFLSCRGSLHHHHAERHGLVRHSTEMLDALQRLPGYAWDCSDRTRSLIQIGLLLHDLGKIHTVGINTRTQIGTFRPHAQMNLILLEPHLAALRVRAPDAALSLEDMLRFFALKPSERHAEPNPPPEAEIVLKLDGLSAAMDGLVKRCHRPAANAMYFHAHGNRTAMP